MFMIRSAKHSLQFTRSFSATSRALDLNKIQLIGYVGSNPVKSEFQDRTVYNYTVATSEVRPDKEGNLIKRTQWHRVSNWRSGDWFDKIKKGDQVYVEGSLRYTDYTDKEGNQKTKAEINQTAFKLLGSRSQSSQEESENQ